MANRVAQKPEVKTEAITAKEQFKSGFKAWIRIVALIVVAVFLPEQVAQAVQYDASVIWRHPVTVGTPLLKEPGNIDTAIAVRNILTDISNKPVDEIRLSPELSVKLNKQVKLSKNRIEEIYQWLQGKPCGSKAIFDYLSYQGEAVVESDIAILALSIDILNGVVKPEGNPEVIKNSMLALSKASEFFGHKLYPIKIDDINAASSTVPFIAHLNGDHYVLVTKIAEDKVYYSDEHQEKFLPKEKFLEKFSGYCLVNSEIAEARILSDEEALQVKGAGDWGDDW
ncbi:MAG: cysteine peptidase family C39 domain-containing protein, partial [Candidatus Omnitrophica bacterium]|nr:cysteine peptidase family C39 domain-containing protein [Candidatus Omnitrophota bacterium]